MTERNRIDWARFDARAKALESALHDLLEQEPFKSDDRRLWRVYVGLAVLLRPQMDEGSRRIIDVVEVWHRTGKYPPELEQLSEQVREAGAALRSASYQTEQRYGMAEFINQLLEACTRNRFSIYPDSDVDPVAWTVAAGVPVEEVERVVLREYPELADGARPLARGSGQAPKN